MLTHIWDFIRQHRMSALTVYNVVITIVFIFIFLWYLPLARDVKGIYAHLMREENERITAEQIVKNREQETVKIFVHDDVSKKFRTY